MAAPSSSSSSSASYCFSYQTRTTARSTVKYSCRTHRRRRSSVCIHKASSKNDDDSNVSSMATKVSSTTEKREDADADDDYDQNGNDSNDITQSVKKKKRSSIFDRNPSDETVVGAEGVPQAIIEAERRSVPLRRFRLATYALSSSVAAAQLVYILQSESKLDSPVLAAASDVCVMIVGSLLWREELRGRAKRLKRIWKAAQERERDMSRAEAGLGETVWTARMRNNNKNKGLATTIESSVDEAVNMDNNKKIMILEDSEFYPSGITVNELKSSEKQRKVVNINGTKVLLQYFMDELYCVSNKCPHLGISMQGKTALLSAEIKSDGDDLKKPPCIVCPAHNTAFDMKTGEVEGEWCPSLPTLPVIGKVLEGEKKPIQVYATKVEEMTGSILVEIPR
jgi:nitrite reductase/ring-hydroxylating ferredoxin subunit